MPFLSGSASSEPEAYCHLLMLEFYYVLPGNLPGGRWDVSLASHFTPFPIIFFAVWE